MADPLSDALQAMLEPLVDAAVKRAVAEALSKKPDPLLTSKELAAYWQVTERTIRNLRAEGLPTQFCGDSPRHNRALCDAWAAERARKDEVQ
jgi:hypothetical protein